MILQAFYFHHQDDQQKKCIVDQFHKLAVNSNARANLNTRDTDATNKVISAVAKAQSQADVMIALSTFVQEQAAIAKERKEHPVPPFPPGKCS